MRKQAFILTLILTLVIGIGLPAMAQITELGARIDGVVKDANGTPIAGAQLQFHNQTSGRKFTTKTDQKGMYQIIGLPGGTTGGPAKYVISVKVNGKEVWKNTTDFSAGEKRTIDITLNPEAAPAPAAAAPAPGAPQQQHQQAPQGKPMSNEEIEKIKAENEKAVKENEKIKILNAAIQQSRTDLKATPPNIDSAITTMEQATAAAPNYDLGWATLGDAYLAAKKWQQAGEAYVKAIDLLATESKPDNAAYHNNLGRAYGNSGQAEKAIGEFNKAVQLDPPNAAMYYFNEGATLTNSGKLDDANAAFDKCLENLKSSPAPADPNQAAAKTKREADANYLRAVNMMSKGQTKDGKFEAPAGTADGFNKYLELQPTGPYAETAKQMLTMIGAPIQTTYGTERKKKK